MRKVKLELDDLAVESFSTAEPEAAEKGTVRGYVTASCAPDPASRCGPNICFPDQDPSEVWGTCDC